MNWPKEWNTKTFPACVDAVVPDRSKQVQTSTYLKQGRFPVVDQGQELIGGWTDREDSVIRESLPLIIFGDHTRVFKYIDFPFALGADGTKVLKAVADEFATRFLYYKFLSLDIPSKGYSRHFKLLREQEIHYPALPEQRKIAAVLFRIQKAIELEEAILSRVRELKKATMQFLFTHGTSDKTWEEAALGSVLKLAQYGLSIRGSETGAYPILRMNCQLDGQVRFDNLQFVDLDSDTFAAFRLADGDLLFNRTNSWELVGRMAIFHADRDAVFASYLIRLKLDQQRVKPDFINYYFNMESTQQDLKGLASRGVSQSNINASKLHGFIIPIPPIGVQEETVEHLQCLDRELSLHAARKSGLQELFKTMLNRLMSGEIRVKDLEIEVSEVGS